LAVRQKRGKRKIMTENIHPRIFLSLLCCGGAYGNISQQTRTYVIAVFYIKRDSSHYTAWPSAMSCLFLVLLEIDNSKNVLVFITVHKLCNNKVGHLRVCS
jgi:hypothetical protein